MVRNLFQYIIKHAQSKYNELDLTINSLHVCFDADAGAGRFVAFFAFMNRLDGKVVLHPFLLYEGSDSRKNMEITMGDLTKAYRNLIDQNVKINKSDVVIKNIVYLI